MQENCDWNMARSAEFWQNFSEKSFIFESKIMSKSQMKIWNYASCLLIEGLSTQLLVDKSPEYSVAYKGVAYKKMSVIRHNKYLKHWKLRTLSLVTLLEGKIWPKPSTVPTEKMNL